MMAAEASLLHQSKAPVTLDVHGTRVLYWPSPDAQQPKATLVFVVGNPGLADYYVQYLSELQRLVCADERATIEIFCLSQLGHDPHALSTPSAPISLEEQIQNKADILSTITGRWTSVRKPTLILAGHSIGAYVVLEIVRRNLSVVPVHAVHLLFPTLHQIGLSPNARRLSWLLKANDRPIVYGRLPSLLILLTWTISIVLRIVQFLPLPLVHFLILCAAPSQPISALKVTSDFILEPRCVQQALHMARDEMKLVKKVQELAIDEQARGNNAVSSRSNGREHRMPAKLRAYWAAGDLDGWAPATTRKVVEETLNLKTYELPADIADKTSSLAVRGHKKRKSYTVDEIRKARRATGGKRRVLAGMVNAGARTGYGLASSLGNIGYRRPRASATAPPPAASFGMRNVNSPLASPQRTLRRRPSLVAARASRRFDGTIVIEPAHDGEEEGLDLLANDPESGVEGIVFSPEQEISSPLEAPFTPSAGSYAAAAASGLVDGQRSAAVEALQMPDRASIVCKVGMPHAFVLEHSDKMAIISSAMILADIL